MENGVEPTSNDQRPAVPLNNVLRADNGSEEVQSSIEIEKSSPTPIGSRKAYLISTLVVLTQLVQMIPFGAGVSGALAIAEDLGVDPKEGSWIVASYPLTQGAFVLIGGRIGAVYGHKNTLLLAGIWWTTFSLISGFMKSLVTLCVMRGLTGIGGALMVPNALALLTINIPPGKMRNIAVAFFGAMAPIGAAGGSVFSGFFVQLTPWKWLFFFLAIVGAILFTVFALVVPGEPEPMDKHGTIDWFGAYLGVAGLILFNFVWNQAPAVGWEKPYEYVILIVSILHFTSFVLWEWKFAKEPILPLTIWTAPSFGLVILVSFLAIMSIGIVICSATYAALAVTGVIAAFGSSWAIPRMPAQYILAFGSFASCVACVLVATTPAHQTYWAQIFPALLCTAFGPDLIFTATQIIASNTVRRDQQGIAGSLMGTVLAYSLSTGLGFAGTVEAYTNDGGKNILEGYRHALQLGIGMSGVAMIIALAFVRVPKDQREGWDENDTSAPPRGPIAKHVNEVV